MKSSITILLFVLVACRICYAQNTEQKLDTISLKSKIESHDTLAPIITETFKAVKIKPICLGRHHIAFSWYGYSTALNDRLNPYYLDARRGEGGFFNYRYSFSEHIDLAVDGRGFINDVDDDSMTVNITAKVFYSGFGVRYTFDRYWVLYPYVQGSIYQTTTDIVSKSKYSVAYNPELYWGIEGNGWGYGINSGIDIRLGKLVSIPIDMSYLYSKPKLEYSHKVLYDGYYKSEYYKEYFSVSSFVISAGVSFNWGKVN